MTVHSSLTSDSQKVEKNKTVEVEVDREYISLQGYISNTSSDREVHVEHQLKVDRST